MKFKRETAVTPARRVHTCLPPPPSTPLSSREGKQGAICCKQPLVKPPWCPDPRAQQSGGVQEELLWSRLSRARPPSAWDPWLPDGDAQE